MKSNHQNSLEALTQRVQEGDLQAKAQLKHLLEPSMARIVRRVLDKGSASTSLERKILAAAQRLAPMPAPAAHAQRHQEQRLAPVARNLCQTVVNRLWPGGTEGSLTGTMVSA
jgi:hypothetical protein